MTVSLAHAGNPSKAGDITGRSLSVWGLGSIGHIGIWNGSKVVEVLNENPVIQYNSLYNFKNRSSYWGARGNASFRNSSYINAIANSQATFNPKYTVVPLNTQIGRNVKQCTQRNSSGICLSYKYVKVQAVFRCDTFVDYIYRATGNGALSSWNLIYPFIAYNNVEYERS